MKMLIKNISQCYGFTESFSVPFSLSINEDGIIEKTLEDSDLSSAACSGDVDCIDASGLCLSPGWIDMHTHIYKGVCDIALDPDLIGPAQGAGTLVDAGSAGHITYPGFRDYIIKNKDYEIYSFLNYGSIGIVRCNSIGDYETDSFIQPKETLECIEQNRNYIKGLKVRACKGVLKDRVGIEIVKAAADLAHEAGVPLMVHVGEPGPRLGDILNTLEAGDILTHCFHGKPGGILSSSNGLVIKEAHAARERGVLFDVGHGASSFCYKTAQEAVKQGFKPDLIGTDLHALNYPLPVGSLSVTMSKMISCGLSTEEVLNAVTKKPAEILKLGGERLSLKPGTKANLTLFKIEEKDARYVDSMQNPIITRIQILPVMTIIGSKKTSACLDKLC